MPKFTPSRSVLLNALALLAGLVILLAPAPAAAQVVAVVNGEPITSLDIAERTKLHRNSGKAQISRKEVLEELIEFKLKLQIAQRANIDPSASDVERAFANMAQRSGRSAAQFEQALTSGGIDVNRLKARVKADLAWNQYLQANSGNVIVRDADLVAAMNLRGQSLSLKSTQYTMQQFVFVTRRNAPDNVRAARLKEAESLRSRVSSCAQAVQIAKEYNEVVVKPLVRKISTDLSPALQKLLETMPDGRMTPPEPTMNGIEVVAICERREIPADVSSNRELRNELLGQRVQNYEKKILDKMRSTSIIQILSEN